MKQLKPFIFYQQWKSGIVANAGDQIEVVFSISLVGISNKYDGVLVPISDYPRSSCKSVYMNTDGTGATIMYEELSFSHELRYILLSYDRLGSSI